MAEPHPAGDTVTIEDLLRIEADDATDWDPDLAPIERVTRVALALDGPRTASTVAERADVAVETTRENLEFLAGKLGVVKSAPTDGGRKYWPDEAYLRFRHVAQLVEKHDEDELTAQIVTLKDRIEAFTEEYGVEGPDELRARTADGDVSAADAREFRTAAREWETVEYQLSTIQDALKRYDEYAGGYRQEVRLGSSDLAAADR